MKIRIRVKNTLGSKRVRTIVMLVGLQGFFMPILQILALEAWPTPVQICRAGVTSVVQCCTMLLGLYDVKVER